MQGYSRIVVGSDGSLAARTAVVVGGRLAAGLGVPVTAVTVWKSELAVPGARELAWARLTTTSSDIDLSDLGLHDVTTIEVEGDAAEALDDISAEVPESLLVVGGAGLGSAASRIAGSPSNQLSHKSSVDVLFVHADSDRLDSVLIATDGSDTSLIAVARGLWLAGAAGASVELVTVAESVEAGEEILDRVDAALPTSGNGATYRRRVLTGNPASALVDAGAEVDLLVIGNRGMSGMARVLGSTANTITHRATTNLLLVNTTGRT